MTTILKCCYDVTKMVLRCYLRLVNLATLRLRCHALVTPRASQVVDIQRIEARVLAGPSHWPSRARFVRWGLVEHWMPWDWEAAEAAEIYGNVCKT